MPPVDRPLPRYTAEPPQEPVPYGRWAESLSERFLSAISELEPDAELGDPGEVMWFPERTWEGRTYVPATATTANGFELFGYVAYDRPDPAEQATDFEIVLDYTDVTAADNPGWSIDLSDQEIGRWRGPEGREGAVTLVWGVCLVADGAVATAELGRETMDQCQVSNDRFTLVSLDDYSGDFLEIHLFGRRGNELARESLYED